MLSLALSLSLAVSAPPRTAVLPLVGGDAISDRAASSLTETLAVELQKQGAMEVVLPHVGGTLLSPLKPRQEVGCTTDACMAEVAGALGAERLVAGEVSWDGGKLVLNLRMLEGRTARVLSMSERAYKKGTLNELLGGLPEMVPELLHAPAPAAVSAKPAVAAAKPATPADPPRATAQAAPGKFVLHYHRRDGRYGAAGLHTWETFNSGAELRATLPGVAYNRNLGMALPTASDPTGTDAFGAYWVLSAGGFRNGRVNFLVRGVDGWDECGPHSSNEGAGKGMFWIVADGAEAWLNVPECELFATREEAERGQRR